MRVGVGFWRDDAGAATIDWVALCAGILILGIMVVYSVFNNGTSSLVDRVNAALASGGQAGTGKAPIFEVATASSSAGDAGKGTTSAGVIGTRSNIAGSASKSTGANSGYSSGSAFSGVSGRNYGGRGR